MASSTATTERTATGRNGHTAAAAAFEFRHQRELEDRERVRGDWIAVDDTDNSIELAETDDPELLMFRGSYNHGRMCFVTRGQLRNLNRAAERDDRIRDLLRA
jgi:hypothetical protein